MASKFSGDWPPLLVATRHKMTKQTAALRISVSENYMKLHLMGSLKLCELNAAIFGNTKTILRAAYGSEVDHARLLADGLSIRAPSPPAPSDCNG